MIHKLKSFFGPESFVRLSANWSRSFIAAAAHGRPAKDMKVIAITGTDGKSTTTMMTNSILESAGKKTGMSCSLDYRINGKPVSNVSKMTTPQPWGLNKLLSQMKQEQVEFAVIETSSHALVQKRLIGVSVDVAVFTNLSREHLDYHGSMEAYRNAKGKLIDKLRDKNSTAVLNKDDDTYEYYKERAAQYCISDFSFDQDSSFFVRNIELSVSGSSFELHHSESGELIPVQLHIPGRVNISNALAAAAACDAVGISLLEIKQGLESVRSVPGRMEVIDHDGDFTIMIDYAVTPDSLTKLYDTLTRTSQGRIIHLFGSCGDRDQGKRPIMGDIVGSRGDIAIVTNEDPYTEDPRSIMNAVMEGVLQSGKTLDKNAYLIEDRKEAIAFALSQAQSGDLIVLTGKGSETSMQIGTQKVPWSEKAVVLELLSEQSKK